MHQIPKYVLAPYNAQATLHFYEAFWALYLPITVPGRVSDIWRSYFAQALFPHLDLRLAFLPRPIVTQDRNPHSIKNDFAAEQDLYLKTSALVDVISNIQKDCNFTSVPNAVEKVFVDMFERGFIEIDDVINVQLWLEALIEVGYYFPKFQCNSQRDFKIKNATVQAEEDISEEVIEMASLGSSMQNQYFKKYIDDKDFNCNINYNVSIGTSDLHDGTRADVASIISHMGQTIIMMGLKTKNEFSNYKNILKMPGVYVHKPISPELSGYTSHSTPLNKKWIESNYNFYKNDPIVKDISGFVCTFPASMCQLWFAFQEAGIIYIPAHRYNLGGCSTEAWNELNQQLKLLAKQEHNTIGAMSRYDLEYMKYYTGLKPLLVPAFSGYYISSRHTKPTADTILIFTLSSRIDSFIREVKAALAPELSADYVYDVYKFYRPEDLTNHPAIVSLPYSVMSYRTVELYIMGIPLFFPSIKFLMNFTDVKRNMNGLGWDRTSTSSPYCDTDPQLEEKMRPKPGDGFSAHPYSPNLDYDQDPEAEMYWMQYADFYDWPYIQHFDNYTHLKELLFKSDLEEISRKMKEEVAIKELKVTRTWCDILTRLNKK